MNGKKVMGVLIAGLIAWSIGTACAQAKTDARDSVAASPVASRLDPAVVKAKIRSLQRQTAVINQLADKYEADAAAQFGATFNALDWRRDFGQRLLYQPVESLSAALAAPDLSTAQNELLNASRKVGQKHSGDSAWNINFLTSPCRIVDTRFGGGGVLGPVYRLWYASAAPATIAGQGGNPAGCGNFPNADGFLLYVTVVPTLPGGPNFLVVQHDNFPNPPSSATMNYYGQNLANFAITACNGCAGFDGGFWAYASGANPHVVVDLLAWTGTIDPVALDCVGTALASVAVGAGGTFSLNAPACPAGYTRVSVSCRSSSFSATTFAAIGPDHQASGECLGINTSGAAVTEFAAARCCRVPGL